MQNQINKWKKIAATEISEHIIWKVLNRFFPLNRRHIWWFIFYVSGSVSAPTLTNSLKKKTLDGWKSLTLHGKQSKSSLISRNTTILALRNHFGFVNAMQHGCWCVSCDHLLSNAWSCNLCLRTWCAHCNLMAKKSNEVNWRYATDKINSRWTTMQTKWIKTNTHTYAQWKLASASSWKLDVFFFCFLCLLLWNITKKKVRQCSKVHKDQTSLVSHLELISNKNERNILLRTTPASIPTSSGTQFTCNTAVLLDRSLFTLVCNFVCVLVGAKDLEFFFSLFLPFGHWFDSIWFYRGSLMIQKQCLWSSI